MLTHLGRLSFVQWRGSGGGYLELIQGCSNRGDWGYSDQMLSKRKVLGLINNRAKGFCRIFVLKIAYPNLEFEIKIVEICGKLSEIYYLEVKHRKCCKPNFFNFCAVNLTNFCRA